MKKLSGPCLLCVCFLLPVAAIAQDFHHDPTWPVDPERFDWGVDEGEVASPQGSVAGIDVDQQRGVVYVLSRTAPHVQIFNVRGEFIDAWSPESVGRLHMLHVDPEGDLWLTDVGLHTAIKYSASGEEKLVLGTPGEPGMGARHFDQPTDVTTSADGASIFVADGYGNNRIARFDRNGRYLAMWGGRDPGTDDGQFILPHSITRLGEKLYVADRSGGRIQVFNLEGGFIEDWRNILEPWGVASHRNRIYVVGRKYGQGPLASMQSVIDYALTVEGFPPAPVGQDLFVFDGSGDVLAHTVLPQGRYVGAVDWVHGVGVDSTGAVYIADVVGNRAQKWLPPTSVESGH